jgi:hypothetical protein
MRSTTIVADDQNARAMTQRNCASGPTSVERRNICGCWWHNSARRSMPRVHRITSSPSPGWGTASNQSGNSSSASVPYLHNITSRRLSHLQSGQRKLGLHSQHSTSIVLCGPARCCEIALVVTQCAGLATIVRVAHGSLSFVNSILKSSIAVGRTTRAEPIIPSANMVSKIWMAIVTNIVENPSLQH